MSCIINFHVEMDITLGIKRIKKIQGKEISNTQNYTEEQPLSDLLHNNN